MQFVGVRAGERGASSRRKPTWPCVAATAVLGLMFSWNEFLRSGAVRATDAPGDVTVYNFLHFEEVQWGELHAAGTLVMLPVLVFALLVQRYIVRGLVSGALK